MDANVDKVDKVDFSDECMLDLGAFNAMFKDSEISFNVNNVLVFMLTDMTTHGVSVPPASLIAASLASIMHRTVIQVLERYDEIRNTPLEEWLGYCYVIGTYISHIACALYQKNSTPQEAHELTMLWADKLLSGAHAHLYPIVMEIDAHGTAGTLDELCTYKKPDTEAPCP
jgi:hypothetical protein